jgi:hypothetical protein
LSVIVPAVEKVNSTKLHGNSQENLFPFFLFSVDVVACATDRNNATHQAPHTQKCILRTKIGPQKSALTVRFFCSRREEETRTLSGAGASEY